MSNRFLVYNGGWAVAMALDVEIMARTKGQKTLDDFFRQMFDRHTETPYTFDHVVSYASEVSGADLSAFFYKYVSGTALIPIDHYLVKPGYKTLNVIYEAEVDLVEGPLHESGLQVVWLRK